MAQHVRIQLDRLNLRRFVTGSAVKLVTKVTREVEVLAKLEARGPYSTGRLAALITSRVYLVGRDVRGDVSSNSPHATVAHDGARPHIIRPRNPGGRLRFYWRKVGHVVNFPYVSHPGMRGKRYLAGPMERVGRRNRFVVFTFD